MIVDSLATDNFQHSNLYVELIEIPDISQFISLEYLYNLLAWGHTKIDDIISKLEKEETIGENPTKHWERNKIVCKSKLKDPNFRIDNKKIESTNENIRKYKMHITELLKFGVIRKSTSRHRMSAFIVNKHSDQVRSKSRMVIDYRRLNNNTIDDGYDIPDKSELTNSTQGSKIYSKFDCKFGFWQIKMHPDNIELTVFTSP